MTGEKGIRGILRVLLKGRWVYLPISLFMLLLLVPIAELTGWRQWLVRPAYTLILISATWSVRDRGKPFMVACCLGAPWLVLSWLGIVVELPDALRTANALLLATFNMFVLGLMVWSIMRTRNVTGETLCQAVSAYLLIGVSWSIMYGIVYHYNNDAFSVNVEGFNAQHPATTFLYFSFSTLSTLGYGDITPTGAIAQGLVMVESTLGPLYLAILIARLVAVYKTGRQTTDQ